MISAKENRPLQSQSNDLRTGHAASEMRGILQNLVLR